MALVLGATASISSLPSQVTLGVPPRWPSDAWFSAAPVRPAALISLLLGASCPHIGAAWQPEGGGAFPQPDFLRPLLCSPIQISVVLWT